MEIVLEVPGQPVPQPRHKISTRGGFGRAYIEARHLIHAYRESIVLAAKLAGRNRREGGCVSLEINCVFARPPSHWTKSGLAKGAPAFPPRCDWDNLGKAVSDAITDSGAVWEDDDQVVDGRVTKRYAARREQARTIIRIRSVEHEATT
jgi:Holliday junction resolvase RusA-like endonuclease